MGIDRAVFNLFNGFALRWAVVDMIVRVLMNDYVLITALATVLLGLWFMGDLAAREGHQKALFGSIAAVVLGNGLIKLLNLVYYRHRPFAFEPVRLLFYRPSDSSFPSNAVMVGFAMAMVVWYTNRKAGLLMVGLAALLGLARIVGGVHFPSDVVGGALIGAGVGYVVEAKLRFLDPLWMAIIRLGRRLLLA